MIQKIIDFYKENWIGAAILVILAVYAIPIPFSGAIESLNLIITGIISTILSPIFTLINYVTGAGMASLLTILATFVYATMGAFAQYLIMKVIRK